MNMIKSLIFSVLILFSVGAFSQSASVSPSRLYYKVAPGGYNSQKIRVTNNGTKAETFKVDFADFNPQGIKGKTELVNKDSVSNHGCSQWLTASPSFFEVAPGETKDVDILLQVPNTPDGNTVRWSAITVKLTQENTGEMEKGENVTGMRIIQSFQFVVHVFQTPPSITFKEATLNKLYQDSIAADSSIVLRAELQNTGEAIIDCAPYLDIVNTQTGYSTRVTSKGFTVLPGGRREFPMKLPKDLPKGTYSIMCYVDYGSDTDIAGYELTLTIP